MKKKLVAGYIICLFFIFITKSFSSTYGENFSFRIKCESPSKIAEKQTIFTATIPNTKIAIKSYDYKWSNWEQVTSQDISGIKKLYPNLYLNRYPLVIPVSITSISPSLSGTKVFVEYRILNNIYSSKALLFGKGPLSLGILQWAESSNKIKMGTEAQYNKSHYWKYIQKFASKIHPESLKKLILADRFIGGDSDYYDWTEGFNNMALIGFNTLEIPPGKELRAILLKNRIKKIGWAVYCPPGYVFDFDKQITSNTALKKWVDGIMDPYINSGYKKTDFVLFNLSDEPGWYYPSMFKSITDNFSQMGRFHRYLREKGFSSPKDFGFKNWNEVIPLGRSVADGPLSKRDLYYWTCRYFPHVSDEYFARVTKILEGKLYNGLPITVNWNFFSGRYFVPGPVANNSDKQSPDAAMGGQDWLRFGEVKGSTCLWTEDWFGDNQSYQWSYYASKFAGVARRNNFEFGGYVVGRAAGKGIEQKILALFGHGAKVVYTYVFGPEYNFPGNCWSDNINVAKDIMKTSTMLSKAENLMYPGKFPIPKVAILTPESSQVWDLRSEKIAHGISDATNTGLNNANVSYMAEVYDLFLALMHANIPVDFVDEKDIKNSSIMKNYSCIYITEPDIPSGCIGPLKKWIEKGGILTTTYGTGDADRYDTPYKFPYYFSTFHQLYGAEVKEPEHPRILINWNGWKTSAKDVISGKYGDFSCAWTKGKITIVDKKNVKVLAYFKNGGPAIIYRKFGQGGVIHYAFNPGLSYFYSQVISGKTGMLGLPDGFSAIVRDYILYPVKIAHIKPFVSVNKPMIEALPLVSKKGIAITILNWSGEKQKDIKITVNLPGKFLNAKSVLIGKLKMIKNSKGISFNIPLNKADIILLYK